MYNIICIFSSNVGMEINLDWVENWINKWINKYDLLNW